VSPLPFADPLSIGEAPHHFESHPALRAKPGNAFDASCTAALSLRQFHGLAQFSAQDIGESAQ
jgi:hypothetical protein